MKRSAGKIYLTSLAVILTFPLAFLPSATLAKEYTFTAIGDLVFPNDINNRGTIVGEYWSSDYRSHGFVYDGTTFTLLDVPGASDTYATGINNRGTIVGGYWDSDGREHGFVYDGTTFTPLDVPGDFRTRVRGINDSGHIVGHVIQGIHGFMGGSGFVYDGTSFSIFDVPGVVDNTIAEGIDSAGIIVGVSLNGGFVYDGTMFSSFSAGGDLTWFLGINNRGTIVGWPTDNTGHDGFVYDGTSFTPLDFPGAYRTEPNGINDRGTIVGVYNQCCGFVATPTPIPHK